MKKSIPVLFDLALFFPVICLIAMGIVFIFSSGINSSGIQVSNEFIKQIIFASVGVIWMIIASLVDYRKLYRYTPYAFGALGALLLYTAFFGRYVNGAKSWLGIGEFGVQPSEFGKIVFILFFAWFLDKSAGLADRQRFIIALCILIAPLILILLQPDLGTASVYIPIFLVMCFFAGIPIRYLILVILSGSLMLVLALLPIWETEIVRKTYPVLLILRNDKIRLIVIVAAGSITVVGFIGRLISKRGYYYWISYAFGIITFALASSMVVRRVLKDYQMKRLIVFLNPDSDPRGAGWNIIQSKIAIGSGGIFGQGFLRGTQSHYRFLPQQSTDFIFSILSEEWGFAGCAAVFVLMLIVLTRTLFIIKNTTNIFGSYIASGIFGMFFYHFIINVGMVMGLMPITGIPLLFLSYGGSALWTAMLCAGILMGINHRKLDFGF
ncbi:MAG: rod shape-determining protein RodA [Treponemataceae bacterium]|nr:MAG: rod shape-determining protein RodA [Treponemataceae bacterium]